IEPQQLRQRLLLSLPRPIKCLQHHRQKRLRAKGPIDLPVCADEQLPRALGLDRNFVGWRWIVAARQPPLEPLVDALAHRAAESMPSGRLDAFDALARAGDVVEALRLRE